MAEPFFDWQLDNEDPETSEYINEPFDSDEEDAEPEDETVYDYEDPEDDYDD